MKKYLFLSLWVVANSVFGQNPNSGDTTSTPTLGATVATKLLSTDGSSIDTAVFLNPFLKNKGSANYIPVFNSNNTAAVKSVMFQNGTNLGINTITPTNKLDLTSPTGSTYMNIGTNGTSVNDEVGINLVTKYNNLTLNPRANNSTNLSWSIWAKGNANTGESNNLHISYFDGNTNVTNSVLRADPRTNDLFINSSWDFTNNSSNIVGYNGQGISSGAFKWISGSGGYAAAIGNTYNAVNGNGLLVKTINGDISTSAFTVAQGSMEAQPNSSQHLFNIRSNGQVSIGTSGVLSSTYANNPWMLTIARGGIYVESFSATNSGGQFTFYSNSGSSNGYIGLASDNNQGYSFRGNGRVGCAEVNVFSDARIKNVINQSDSNSDLEILNKLKITNYQYKDVYVHGAKINKKVIAQEVEEVFPQAVTKTPGFIPSIYKMANAVKVISKNQILIEIDVKVDIQKNDVVKCYLKDKPYLFVVDHMVDSHTIVLSGESIPEDIQNLFVYGKEVSDFRNVDYDAISMLNVSATQALYNKIGSLENRLKRIEEMLLNQTIKKGE